MHLFAIGRQLPKRMLSIGILSRAIILVRVDWVPRSMPEQLIDHNQLRLLAHNAKDEQANKPNVKPLHLSKDLFIYLEIKLILLV
jgi:hypothetical protein